MTMSLDGFVTDQGGDLAPLYPDLEALRETEMLKASIRDTGAVLMGRRAFDMAKGDMTGYEYQVPIFVLTHHVPPVPPKGQNDRLRVHFVTDGLEDAVRRAKEAAGERDVTVVGGADTLHQLLVAGHVDVLAIGVVPIFLGAGLRMFSDADLADLHLVQGEVIQSPGRTDLFYHLSKPNT